MNPRTGPSRRDFLRTSAAALAVPTIVPATVFAKDDQPAPSDRVVVGSIGTGDLGRRHHLNNKLLPNKRIARGCGVRRRSQPSRPGRADVFTKNGQQSGHLQRFSRPLRPPRYRRRVDRRARPLARSDGHLRHGGRQGRLLRKAADALNQRRPQNGRGCWRYNTVFQTGSQQRSDRRFRLACELVRNNKIGKLVRVDTHIGNVDQGSWQPATTPPAELDWNFWLGPAPYADYAANRCHYQFRWFSDYSGGKMTDWGAHHNDIAQWGIGADGSGPVKVSGHGIYDPTGPHDVAREFDVKYTYANGVELNCHSKGLEVEGLPLDKKTPEKKTHNNGVLFTGTDGWIFVDRGTLIASNPDLYKTEFTSGDTRLYVSADHHENWLDCIASREKPVCDVEVGHRSATVCHLGNLAMRLGRELQWDPAKEQFVSDDQANLIDEQADAGSLAFVEQAEGSRR